MAGRLDQPAAPRSASPTPTARPRPARRPPSDMSSLPTAGAHPRTGPPRPRSRHSVSDGRVFGIVCPVDRGDLVRLRRAREQMDREYADPLDVEALARTACMSSGHFSRSFRAAYGETPYSYLMTRRIERAMTLLRRGDLSVTDVCFEVGCSSLGTFSTRFTRARRGEPERLSGPRSLVDARASRLPGASSAPTRQDSRSDHRRERVASSPWT
jgi:AraC-like DNA-binding protein